MSVRTTSGSQASIAVCSSLPFEQTADQLHLRRRAERRGQELADHVGVLRDHDADLAVAQVGRRRLPAEPCCSRAYAHRILRRPCAPIVLVSRRVSQGRPLPRPGSIHHSWSAARHPDRTMTIALRRMRSMTCDELSRSAAMIADTRRGGDRAARDHLAGPRHRADRDGRRACADRPGAARSRSARSCASSPTSSALGTVDCVLLSHLHADHTDLRSLRGSGARARCSPRLRRGLAVEQRAARRAPSSARRRDRGCGPADRRDRGGARPLAGGRSDPRRRPDRIRDPRVQRRCTSPATPDLFLGMAELRGAIDVALLPIWGWGSSVGAGHLDPQSAAEARLADRPVDRDPDSLGNVRAASGRCGARAIRSGRRGSSPSSPSGTRPVSRCACSSRASARRCNGLIRSGRCPPRVSSR